jgi:hypothetical protein
VKHSRIALASLGALAATSLALSACSTNTSASGGASASPSASVAAGVALTNSILALGGQGFDIAATEGTLSGTGSIDPSTEAGSLEIKGTQQGVALDVGFTEIGNDIWAKVDLGALSGQLGIDPKKWMKLDGSKLTGIDAKPFDLASKDPLQISKLITSVADVKRVDATHLTGTVDLTAATGPSAPDPDAVNKAGAAAKALPFAATLDNQGRLTELKINASSDIAVDIKLSNFGSPTAVTPPPTSDVIPAPAMIYQFFNSAG